MRTTSSISFYCRPSKADKKGYSPIELSLIINGKRTYVNLPRKEKPETFKREIKKRTSDLNAFLAEVQAKVNSVKTELITKGQPITADNIKEYMTTGGIRTYTVTDLFDEYLSLIQKRVGVDMTEDTFKKYCIVKDEFLNFIDGKLEASTITSATVQSFYVHINQTQKQSTTASKMTKLKTVFRFGFDAGKLPVFPFNGVKIVKGTPNIEYLTSAELDRIANHKFDSERLQRVADMFIFQSNSGLAYADINALTKEDMQEHNGQFYIKKQRVKTGIEYTAIILPQGMKIWNKYQGNLPKLSNQRYNCYLKEIADLCHITKDIHTHIARKSYATHLLNSNVSLTSVAKMLGHSNTIITQKSYAKVLDETVFEEVKNI